MTTIKEVRIVLQRDEKDLLERLQQRVREELGIESNEHLAKAIEKAFYGLVKEFKDETIRIV
jgi:hypothetical protein